MKVAVLSSVYGGFDTVKPHSEQDFEADWVLITDQPTDVIGWRTHISPQPNLHPRLAAKIPKFSPELFSSADVLIWIDGNLEIISPGFVRWCVESLGDSQICQWQFPLNNLGGSPFLARPTIYSEVGMAQGMPKYAGLPLRAQADFYVARGFPPDYGTWWTGLIIRSKDCPSFGDAWLAENVRWSYEDQISEPFVLHSVGLRPKHIHISGMNAGIREFEWFRFTEHNDRTN